MSKHKVIDYDAQESAGTETQVAVDQPVEREYGSEYQALKVGFSTASGVRGEVMESGGHADAPELEDEAISRARENPVNKENAGLADS